MKKILVYLLSVILSLPVPIAAAAEEAPVFEDVQYVIYLGTNDKDTNEPVFSPEESMEKAKEILLEYFGGYTIQEAQGGWIGEDGTIYQEYTLVIYLSDTNKDQVHEAADEMLDTFHQGSVLIQTIPTQTEFYYYQASDEADETEEAELDAAA